jgi:hypothetical protein
MYNPFGYVWAFLVKSLGAKNTMMVCDPQTLSVLAGPNEVFAKGGPKQIKQNWSFPMEKNSDFWAPHSGASILTQAHTHVMKGSRCC